VSFSRKLTFASYCFLQFNSATDILLYSACMYIPLVSKLTMHSIRKFLIHITVFSVIHSIALDKLSSDMHSYTFCLDVYYFIFFVVKMQGAHMPGAHMPGADMTGAYIPGAHMPRAHITGAHMPGLTLVVV
jgi:hypothetical protein